MIVNEIQIILVNDAEIDDDALCKIENEIDSILEKYGISKDCFLYV